MKVFTRSSLFFFGLMLLLPAATLATSVLTVTTNADTDDGVCDSHCSLREALYAAASGDTISFALELRGSTIDLQRTLTIEKRITIDGPNKRRITIRGNGTFRIIHINIRESPRIVLLDGLIIRDGNAGDGVGGGVYIDQESPGTFLITNCAILNNTAAGGGGISTFFGRFYLIDSTVAGNTATRENHAGGVDIFRSSVLIINSTISGNNATSVTDGAGGIRLTGSPNWNINNSTIANNSTNGLGHLYSARYLGRPEAFGVASCDVAESQPCFPFHRTSLALCDGKI